MKQQLSIVGVVLSAVILWSSAAHATRCGWFDAESGFPGAEPGSKVMHCFGALRYPGQDEHTYTLYQPARKGPLGLCTYSFALVFKTTDANGKTRWGYHRPDSPHYVPQHKRAMMETEARICPPQDDPRYINVTGASEGVVKLILQRWNRMMSSTDLLVDFINGDGDSVFSELLRRQKEGLKPHIEISAINQTLNGPGFHYEIAFRQVGGPAFFGWGLLVDVTDNGFVWLATIKSVH